MTGAKITFSTIHRFNIQVQDKGETVIKPQHAWSPLPPEPPCSFSEAVTYIVVITPICLWHMKKQFFIHIWLRILKNSQVLMPDGSNCGISNYSAIPKLPFRSQAYAYSSPKSIYYTKGLQQIFAHYQVKFRLLTSALTAPTALSSFLNFVL